MVDNMPGDVIFVTVQCTPLLPWCSGLEFEHYSEDDEEDFNVVDDQDEDAD